MGIGSISKSGENTFKFRVESLNDIYSIIIPHFKQFPLQTQKFIDFLLFKNVIELIKDKDHLTIEGLNKIVSIKASINKGMPDDLKSAFPNIEPFTTSPGATLRAGGGRDSLRVKNKNIPPSPRHAS